MIKIKLSELLGKNKMTRKALAEMVDARPNTIGDLYHEKVKRVELDLLSRICEALDCEISDLLEYQPDEE